MLGKNHDFSQIYSKNHDFFRKKIVIFTHFMVKVAFVRAKIIIFSRKISIFTNFKAKNRICKDKSHGY